MAGIGVHAWQYQQSCMLISVECADDPGDSTWQQFTPSGPRAFPAAVRPLGLKRLVRPARSVSCRKHDQRRSSSRRRQSLSGALGTGDAEVPPPAHPASCAVCSARPGAGGRWRTPFIHWRGRGLILAIVMSMPCWRSRRKRARPRRRLGQPAGAEALPGAAASG